MNPAIIAALQARIAPIIIKLLQSPEVKKDAALCAEVITRHILELIHEEVVKACEGNGISRYVRLIIKKLKELFGLFKNKGQFHAADDGAGTPGATGSMSLGAAAAPQTAPTWVDTRTQAELAVLSAGISAMANHESWTTTRDALIPNLVSLLFNYGAARMFASMQKK